jgi:hypothetical protein
MGKLEQEVYTYRCLFTRCIFTYNSLLNLCQRFRSRFDILLVVVVCEA